MAAGPAAIPPGDQRARRLRGRRRARRVRQARRLRGGRRGAGRHARAPLPGETVSTQPGTPLPCSAAELRGLFLFEKLTGDQLDWLCREGRVLLAGPGPVYTEGEPA